MFSLRFLIFFFALQISRFWCVVVAAVASLRKSTRRNNKKKTVARWKTWRCFVNAREIIHKKHKVFRCFASFVVHAPTTVVHCSATTTHRHRRRFSYSRNVVRCFFPSSTVVCVKVAMWVFFFVVFPPCYTTFFHYKRLVRDVLCVVFFLRNPRQLKKEFLWELWKRHFSIDGFLLSCRRVVYFNPAEFCSLSLSIEELKEIKKEKNKNYFRIHVFEGSCYIQFISFRSDSLGLIQWSVSIFWMVFPLVP